MKTAIVHPNSLIGQSVRERLKESNVLQVDCLVTTREDEVGTLAEAGGEAALIQQLSGAEADLYFVCGTPQEQQAVSSLVERGIVIHMEPTQLKSVPYSVAGLIPLDEATAIPNRIYCPSAFSVALGLLIAPLAELNPTGSVVVLRGASSMGGEALDELLEQTRSILNFSGDMPTEALSVQLAFNAVDTDPKLDVSAELASLLPKVGLRVRTLDVGLFHGVGLAIDLTIPATGEVSDCSHKIARRLSSSPYIEVQNHDNPLGTVTGAAANQIMLGRIESRASESEDGQLALHHLSIWAVFDNLTLSARSAVELAEELATSSLIAN